MEEPQKVLTSWLQTSATNQESIDIRLLSQIFAVLLTDAATVEDSRIV